MSGVVQDLFSNQPIRRFLKKTRYLFAAVLALPLAYFIGPDRVPAGLAISLFGQLIQGWCFASLVKNTELSVRGPYLLVRNPMYLGRYFLILGFVWLLDYWPAVATYTILYYPYMHYRVMREEKRLLRIHRDAFEGYCREVRRFLPSLRNLGNPHVRFWDNAMFVENNGHWNIVLTLAAFAAVWGLHRFLFT